MPHKNSAARRKYMREWRKKNPTKQPAYDRCRQRKGKERSRYARYGLTEQKYQQLHAAQKGLCAVCLRPETCKGRGGSVRPLAVDHNHTTHVVRELLCVRCNAALGYLREDPLIVQSLLNYIRRHSG